MASITMVDTNKLSDFRINVSFANTFLVKTIEGPPVTFPYFFRQVTTTREEGVKFIVS